MARIKRRVFLSLLTGSLLAPLLGSCTTYSFASRTKPNQLSVALILQKINEARKVNGKKPLIYNDKLAQAAQNQVSIMAEMGILSHELNGKLRERVTRVGYRGAVGENVAGGQRTLEQAIEGWLESRAHRATLLSEKFTEFGLAYSPATKGIYSTYWSFIAGGSFDAWLS